MYNYEGGDWVQIGNDIHGGGSVTMSADGSRIAIGARGYGDRRFNVGHVRVYDLKGGEWFQVGNDIRGEYSHDQSGGSVAMSADGTRVAIGATGNNGNGLKAGHVRVYDAPDAF